MEKKRILAFALLLLLFTVAPRTEALASQPTDEILNFTVTAEVNEDASVNMLYHIDWKVLESDGPGPLTWMEIGLPNSSHKDLQALSETVDHLKDKGSTVEVWLDREYFSGETASVDFSFTQKKMYQIDRYEEGETVYQFTPAWFDGISVDTLRILWKEEKAQGWQPDCFIEDGYLVWETSLSPGEKYTVSVTYPGDAYAFDPAGQSGGSGSTGSKNTGSKKTGSGSSGSSMKTPWDLGIFLLSIVGNAIPLFMLFLFARTMLRLIRRGRGFGGTEESDSTEGSVKKIIRVKIVFYDSCPGCGAVRKEGQETCEYCGRSLIKSREEVEEKDIENPERYSSKGVFRYGNSNDTYIHVHVINTPPPRRKDPPSGHGSSGHGASRYSSSRHSSSGGGSSRRSSSGRSSSGRSSCACACASSCACACACASSGRAGCSVKDFYGTDRNPGLLRVDSGERRG